MKLFQPPQLFENFVHSNPWLVDWMKRVSSRFGSNLLPTGITVAASPFVVQNTTDWDQSIIVQGGTVSKIEYSRDTSTYYDVGVIAGMFWLSPLDYLRVTYTVAPTMTTITR